MRTGVGKLSEDNGLIYEGGLLDNMRHGFGILNDGKGNVYSGSWYKDIK